MHSCEGHEHIYLPTPFGSDAYCVSLRDHAARLLELHRPRVASASHRFVALSLGIGFFDDSGPQNITPFPKPPDGVAMILAP